MKMKDLVRIEPERPPGPVAVPVLHNLLSDHLDVFKAVHAADVVHQDVGVSVADATATQVQPLLQETKKMKNDEIMSALRHPEMSRHVSDLTYTQRV